MNLKVITVSGNTTEFEKLLNQGWKVQNAFAFNKGLMVILQK